MNQMNNAPTSAPAEPTLADKIKDIDDQIEEAHMTFNNVLVAKLQADKTSLKAQEIAAQEAMVSKPETVSDVLNEGDPAKLAELDDRFAVIKPLDNAHVQAKWMNSLEESIPRMSSNFNKRFNDATESLSFAEKPKEVPKIMSRLADLSENFEFDQLPANIDERARDLGISTEELKGKYYDGIKNTMVKGGLAPEIFDALISQGDMEVKQAKIQELLIKKWNDEHKQNHGNY